jgi:hypothetical protein
MQKLEAELATLKARAELLNITRPAARVAFDSATIARQTHLLEGDVEDVNAGNRLQANVDSALSALRQKRTNLARYPWMREKR